MQNERLCYFIECLLQNERLCYFIECMVQSERLCYFIECGVVSMSNISGNKGVVFMFIERRLVMSFATYSVSSLAEHFDTRTCVFPANLLLVNVDWEYAHSVT